MIREIEKLEYEKFNSQCISYSFFQTSDYSVSRLSNYEDVKLVGLFKDNELIGTTQMLFETIPYINKKMITSIKGINIDFTNDEYLSFFQESMKKYLKENNGLLFRFDIPIGYRLYDAEFKELKEIYNNETFIVQKDIKENLKKANMSQFFIDKNYMGRSPQYSMLVNTKSVEGIENQMNRSVKRAIKTAQKYGLEVEVLEQPTDDKLKIFYELHSKNAKRNNINIQEYDYYKNMFSKSSDMKLFLVKINNNDFIKLAQTEYDKSESKKNKKILDLALTKEDEEVYILGHVSSFFNKVGYDLFTGLDYDYKDLGSKEFVMKSIFEYANNNNIDYYDFWGILGRLDKDDPMYPIYTFKKKFSNIIVEYPGFWDIYTNKILYKIFVKYSKIKYFKKK